MIGLGETSHRERRRSIIERGEPQQAVGGQGGGADGGSGRRGSVYGRRDWDGGSVPTSVTVPGRVDLCSVS